MKKIKNLRKIRPEIWLILILIFALIIRLYFFIGLVNADPQDDGIYIFYIKDVVEGKHDIKYFSQLANEETVNPVNTFKVRNGFLFPEAFFVKLLGYNQIGFTFYPLICSLLTIVLAYFFGKNIFMNANIGLLSSLLISFYPLDVTFSTKISPDIPLACFISLSIYFTILSFISKRKTKTSSLLAGVFASIAYTIKTFGIILFPVIISIIFYYYFKKNERKKLKLFILYFIVGFLPIFLINEAYFYLNTGHVLLEPTINRKAQMDNFRGSSTTHVLTENFRVLTTFGEPIEFLKLAFGLKESKLGVNYFGYFYFVLFFSLSLLLIKKKFNKSAPVLIWLAVGIAILEFSPVGIELKHDETLQVNYLLIPKEGRFMTMLTLPTVIIVSLALFNIQKSKTRKLIVFLVIVFLFTTSIFSINKIHDYFKDGIRDVETASRLIPFLDKPIYMDHLARGEIRYFTGFKYDEKIKDFSGIVNETQLKDSYILVGGARGVDIYWKVAVDIVPDFIKDTVIKGNDKWKLIEEIKGVETGYRNYSLRIYYVPL